MSLVGKFSILPPKKAQKIKDMALFRRQSSKRKNSRNLVKRYCRLIR